MVLRSNTFAAQEISLQGTLVHEERLHVPGLPSITESLVLVCRDQDKEKESPVATSDPETREMRRRKDSFLILEVVRYRAAAQPERYTRELSRAEVDDIMLRGGMENEAPDDFYAWLCHHVEAVVDQSGHQSLAIQGFEEDKITPMSDTFKSNLRSIFSATQERIRLGAEMKEAGGPGSMWMAEEEKRKRDIQDVAKRCKISADTAKAIYDWHAKMDFNGDGRIDFNELAAGLQQAMKAADRRPLSLDQAFRFWKELQSCMQETILFPHFATWVVAKFPHISAMTTHEVRRFMLEATLVPDLSGLYTPR